MSQYRDELDAARHRVATLEAQVAERDAALRAREAEIAEHRREIDRAGRAGRKTPARTPWALTVLSLFLGVLAAAFAASLIAGNGARREQERRSAELSEEVETLSEQVEREEGENRKLRDLVEKLRSGREGREAASPADPPAVGEISARQGTIPEAHEAHGLLNIQSNPIAKVMLDAKPIGNTPLAQVRAAPGLHVLMFIYPGGKSQSIRVTVEEGKTQTISAKLPQEGSAADDVF